MQAVTAEPGITFRALARRVGAAAGTVRHHLNVLQRFGVLREERVGFAIVLVRADDERNPAHLRVLREPAMRALRDLVASAGRICQRDVMHYLDGICSRSTVQHRLSRLVRAGVLRVTWQGRYLFYEVVA